MNEPERETVSAAAAAIPMPQTSDSLSRDQLSQLFTDHHRRVLIAAYRVTGSMADAEDIAQTVFLRLGSGESIPMRSAGSYLYRAAVNGALDLLRRRKVAAADPIEAAESIISKDVAGSPDAALSQSELASVLRQAISELAPRPAEMFTLRYIEGLGNREIAALMNTSQAVVAVTLHQTRSKLKKRLIALERGKS